MNDFLKRNGSISEDQFMTIAYRCILNCIAYNVCEQLKNDKIDDFKTRAKKRGKDGEVKTAKQLFSSFNLNDEELNYVSKIVVTYVYKPDRKSIDKIKKILTKTEELKCNSCGKILKSDEVRIDHIDPYAFHGDFYDPSRYQILCNECNQKKLANAFFPLIYYCKSGQMPHYIYEQLKL